MVESTFSLEYGGQLAYLERTLIGIRVSSIIKVLKQYTVGRLLLCS